MISLLKTYTSSSPETRILLISPPPVNTIARRADLASRDPPQELDRDFDVTRRYADVAADVAREEGVAFVDVWNRIWDEAGREESKLTRFLVDGLHLSGEGYAVSHFLWLSSGLLILILWYRLCMKSSSM